MGFVKVVKNKAYFKRYQYSTVNHIPHDSAAMDEKISSGPKQRSIKKLTPSFRSLSLNAIEPPNKGQVRSINSCPTSTFSTTPAAQEPLYAIVTKPRIPNETKNDQKSHWQTISDYVHQLGPLPVPLEDVDFPPPDESQEILQDDLLGQAFDPLPEDCLAEGIYSEPKDYDGRASWEVSREYHLPEEILGPEEVEKQAEGFSTYDNLMSQGKGL